MIRCLFGLHRWRWFSLHDNDVRLPPVRLSQCDHCRTLKGGWRGVEFKEANPHG